MIEVSRSLITAVLVLVSTSFVTTCRTAVALGSGVENTCPNEALRAQLDFSGLPDCRAYEMVTPSYKEGYAMFPNSYAADGEKAMVRSSAAIEGALGAGETAVGGSFYIDTRTPSGWRITPLNPPQAEFAGQLPVRAEADTGEMLWIQHTSEQSASVTDLYARSATGSFSLIGPLNPKERIEEGTNNVMDLKAFNQVIGATSDYGHVLVRAKGAGSDWPFDATIGILGSLYEYSGINRFHPTLVGVEGEKGSTQLIGLCGTLLGAYKEGSAYNAISRDGETIFFAVVPRGLANCTASAPSYPAVYARIHGAMTSPLKARTVNIGKSECSTACGGESGKNFAGAAEDGSRAYFTSTQKLTNTAIDGTESGDATTGEGCSGTPIGQGGCNLYEYDFNAAEGRQLNLVAAGEVLGVASIASDGSRVYFVDRAALPTARPNPYGGEPEAEHPNLYVFDATSGKTAFIATLINADESVWEAPFERSAEAAGDDGRYLLFASAAPNVTPDDTSTLTQLFEYKSASSEEPAELVRVTKGEEGFNEDGNGVLLGVERSFISGITSGIANRTDFKSTTNRMNISTDGQTVFFTTAGQLSPRAVSAQQGCLSLYEFHATDTELSSATVKLVSDGRDVQLVNGTFCGVAFQRMSATGSDVLFLTADALLTSDTDGGQRDLYDARVDGGFASPAASGICGPGLCEGSSGTAPDIPIAGSVGENGEAPAPSVKIGAAKKGGYGNKKRRRAHTSLRCGSRRVRHVDVCGRTIRHSPKRGSRSSSPTRRAK